MADAQDIATHLDVAALVAVLVAESSEQLGSGVPLLGRGVLVVAEDLVDDRLDRTEQGCGASPGPHRRWLGMREDMPDGPPGMTVGNSRIINSSRVVILALCHPRSIRRVEVG